MIALLSRLLKDRRGNVFTIFAISLPLMIGALGLGVEGVNWYQTKRALQNAADEAVVAAATNNGSTYLDEAKAVAASYGYANGSNNVTVTANNSATCPTGISGTCYSVTITKKLPLLLTGAVGGFVGNDTIGSAAAEKITATAIASYQTGPRYYCLLSLSTTTSSVMHGTPKANLAGCSTMGNASFTCTGHGLQVDYADSAGTSSGCAANSSNNNSNMPVLPDPYSSLASNIPSDTCAGKYSTEGSGKKGGGVSSLPSSNKISGSVDLGAKTFCGDVGLTGNVTLNGTDNVIVIRNGELDTNGYSITTASGAAATIIFTGPDSSGSYQHTLAGSGTVDLSSPTSGTWSGVAIYTDPSLTKNVDISAAGNSPSWTISGLAYFPHASVTWSGDVGHATNGHQCFVMVVDNVTVNGTGYMLQNDSGECAQQGLNMPYNALKLRGRLVG